LSKKYQHLTVPEIITLRSYDRIDRRGAVCGMETEDGEFAVAFYEEDDNLFLLRVTVD
jgi:hypothetical protein